VTFLHIPARDTGLGRALQRPRTDLEQVRGGPELWHRHINYFTLHQLWFFPTYLSVRTFDMPHLFTKTFPGNPPVQSLRTSHLRRPRARPSRPGGRERGRASGPPPKKIASAMHQNLLADVQTLDRPRRWLRRSSRWGSEASAAWGMGGRAIPDSNTAAPLGAQAARPTLADLLLHGPVADAVCAQLGLLSSNWGSLNVLRGAFKVAAALCASCWWC
jgi:hypothetical protein